MAGGESGRRDQVHTAGSRSDQAGARAGEILGGLAGMDLRAHDFDIDVRSTAELGPDASVTVLHDGVVGTADRARISGGDVWLPLEQLESAAGWDLKPEGVCRGEICVPLRPTKKDAIVRDECFNLTEFARLIEEPVANDVEERIWGFGPPGWDWKSRTTSDIAPDFAAPDLAGQQHWLHELLGKKVLLLF